MERDETSMSRPLSTSSTASEEIEAHDPVRTWSAMPAMAAARIYSWVVPGDHRPMQLIVAALANEDDRCEALMHEILARRQLLERLVRQLEIETGPLVAAITALDAVMAVWPWSDQTAQTVSRLFVEAKLHQNA